MDLLQPPAFRWQLSLADASAAQALIATYKRDLGIPGDFIIDLVQDTLRADCKEYWEELKGLEDRSGIPFPDLVVGNLYYDALKAVLLGCTAFAVDTPSGPIHARNLDWWSENDLLRQKTRLVRFSGAPAGDFTTVGWPGFVGAFSGVARNRFAITLNAVLSAEPLQLATPVVFAIRRVFEEARDFQSALETLRTLPLASDSLILLTGIHPGEMAVIERTPTRSAVRLQKDGCIFVTNDYKHLQNPVVGKESELLSSACSRFDRISDLVRSSPPLDPTTCFQYLNDSGVRMGMTMQQMVFQAASGLCLVE